MFNNVKLLNKSMNRNIDYITINSNSVEPSIVLMMTAIIV